MAEKISAEDLQVGDVYRSSRGKLFPEPVGDAYQVTSIRTVRYVQTYRVIEAIDVRSGLRAEINLLRDVDVFKLERIGLADVRGLLLYMGNGQSMTVVRHDDAFWL